MNFLELIEMKGKVDVIRHFFKSVLGSLIYFVFLVTVFGSENFKIQLGGTYQSKQVFRGAEIWPNASMGVGPLFIFYENIYLAGPNLFFRPTQRTDSWQWQSGISFFNDNRPWIRFGDHEKDYRNLRESIWEANFQVSYNFGWKKKFQLGTFFSKEIKEDVGVHSEVFGAVPFLPFTTIQGRVSYSEKSMNRYLYGPSALSGWGYGSLGIRGVIPFLPWGGIMMLGVTRSWVLQSANERAFYVQGRGDHNVFNMNVFWNTY